MKRFFAAILCAGLIAATTAGCGYKDALDTQTSDTQTEQTGEQASAEPEVKASDFNNDLEGLCNYFENLGYISKDENKVTKMDSSLIGAEKGNKYINTYNGKQITIELYEYKENNLNDAAKQIIKSVKENGTFTILDLTPVSAYISDNGKYLMIYKDDSIDDSNPDTESSAYTHREEVIKNFKQFYK